MATNHDIPQPARLKAAYTITEVAQLLGLHRTTVSGFVNRGELRAARLGHRTIRISHEALMDFLKSKEVVPEPKRTLRRRNQANEPQS
jgi:excisionase family DNA binding protein